MEWLDHAWDFVKQAVNPETILRVGGLALLGAVIFAETGLLIGFFLPGDSLLFTAGLLTATGVVDAAIWQTVLTIWLAAWAGDQCGYIIGAKYGPRVFRRKESLLFRPEYVTLTADFYQRNGNKALMLGHWVPIVRSFVPVFAGVAGLPYRRFLLFTGVGSLLWAAVLTLAGYFLGNVPGVAENLHYIVVGFIVVTTVPIVRTMLKESKLRKQRTSADTEQAQAQADAALDNIIRQERAHQADQA